MTIAPSALASPVGSGMVAGELTQWRFDRDRNQLTFTTSEAVQPRAQFLPESGRLVIDLPGASWRQETIEQRLGGAVTRIQVVPFGEDTARLIVQLSPGFTLDARQVHLRSLANNQWVVDLPPVQRAGGLAGNEPREPWIPGALREALEGSGSYQGPRSVVVEGLESFDQGFVLQTRGGQPAVQVSRSRDRRQIFIDVRQARLPSNRRLDRLISQQGVSRLILNQITGNPPRVRLILVVGASSPDWQAVANESGQILITPSGEVAVNPPLPGPIPIPETSDPANDPNRQPRFTWPGQRRRSTPPQPQTGPDDLPPFRNDPRIPLNRALVFIDPGHGGYDYGAIGIGGIQEKEIVLDISRQVASLLQQQGIRVAMARDRDFFVSLQGRTDMANQMRATIFVSIHANSADLDRPEANGIETYYHESGAALARSIHTSIMQTMPYMNNRGVRRARFYVLRNSRMPSVLVETGFVTGNQDASLLSDRQWRSQMAAAIVRGILNYFR